VFAQDNKLKVELIDKMIKAIDDHNQMEFKMYRSERSKNGFTDGKFYAKLINKPYKLYIKNFKPKPGSEILYIKGQNDDKALINPNSFPYFSISLDPDNNLLLAGGHHSLREAGFTLFSNMFKLYKVNYGEELYNRITYHGMFKWNDRVCYKISIDYPDYSTKKYTPKKGETLYSISRDQLLNIGKLREYNVKYDDDDILDVSDEIIIQNVYAKKAIIFIDNENYFPIYQLIYDEEGLYEKYQYVDLNLDISFKNEEFTRDYPEYNF
tara:strand:+ start:48 stop:848 length:801 start_codon:yes stop_codon:yes gene_type:complete